jgi:ABC-type transport system involved in multi-copper enzyme maturation permease subunit
MFGALFFERDPLRAADLPAALATWAQVFGGFAAVGLVLWLLLRLPRMRKVDRDRIPPWQSLPFLVACIATALAYAAAAILSAANAPPGPEEVGLADSTARTARLGAWQELALTIAGACALVAISIGFLVSSTRMSGRRILALTKLSFKEALRRRVLYAFSLLLLVLLFGSWFMDIKKPSDQVRTYVGVVYLAMTVLLLFTAALLASFSIPSDIKQQTIHTIVTKPVERFEVVLGRFLGFYALMTLVLLFMVGVSLVYVLRGINPEAAAESLKARVPLYGELQFDNTEVRGGRSGINVGREWDYRRYITGAQTAAQRNRPQTARWEFAEVPAKLADRDTVRVEFSFDIYRTTKGLENRGVTCTFAFHTWRYREGNDLAYRKELGARRGADPAFDSKLAERYGYYEVKEFPVTDYTTQAIDIPAGLIRNALDSDPKRREELQRRGLQPAPLTVRVYCGQDPYSRVQYVGMAKYDMYLRLDKPGGSEKTLFALNFLKASFGLWLQLGLMIGMAVALSTYLSGVITLLVTLLFFMGGLSHQFIQEVATGKNVGGGPMESMVRLARRELTGPSMKDDTTTGARIVNYSDEGFRWVIRRILKAIPDVDRFDLTPYVAEGFDISLGQMALSFLLLLAYLVPWAVLAFYLLNWREIAAPT